MREIKKVRFDGKLLIQYTEFTTDHDDRYTIECTDKPRPEFREALAALVDDVVELCEFSENEKKSLIVYGVTWTYSDKKGEQAVILAKKNLLNSMTLMRLTTPKKAYDGENMFDTLKKETVEKLDNLKEECMRYIDGDRAQMNLFDPVAEDKQEGV